jgi:hypothetical protein
VSWGALLVATLALIPLAYLIVRLLERWSRVRWYQDVLRSGSDVDEDIRPLNILKSADILPFRRVD